MARTSDSDAAPQPGPQLLHRAARIEDAFHAWRERRGRRRGLTTTIVPYTGYGSPHFARILCRVVLGRADAPAKQRAEKVRGWRSFFSIPVDNAEVTVSIDGEHHRLHGDRGGVVDARIEVSLSPGWHAVTLSAGSEEPVSAQIFIINPQVEFGVISDVDDTVMVTALPRPFLAAWNTFVLDEHARRPVPGIAVLYERLVRKYPGSPVIYLSTGAWNVAPTLSRFLARNLYPKGPLLLTDWGPTHDRWFRSGREHKESSLERIAEEFPTMRWLLIGDDGQHDEDIYGDFAARHPQNVAAVAIRQLSTSEAVFAGGRSKAAERAKESSIPWFYAPDGARLASQLAEAGLLPL
jgi:phosphatidate phosphatase APP1